ncbi:hypothetical protein FRC98_11300 [Lujinxingia vulgaris]|uniref:Transposase IS200-like domain-containing protein n=1 Tax=Lujinxingia vulgaris TaxID=2600176 RepID=A0A5C6X616_9DELT|nr:transposase [Lujinxingia vulgaris]TXD37309.1 hypothetical protein FRC98_11300 [Lujinxingia vulgaris]
MTRPRRHLPGQVVAITRRCFDRTFYLRPDDTMNAIALYVFANAAQTYDIEIHALVVMSNHIHLIITDVKGRRSEFMRDAMCLISKARNRDLDRTDYLWEGGSYRETLLLDRDALERKLLYTWLNPLVDDLVERAHEWPGAKILPCNWGTSIKIPKPDVYFGRKSPDFARFTPQPPPGFNASDIPEVTTHFETLLTEAEDDLIATRTQENRQVLGVEKILASSPFSKPKTPSPRSKIIPRFATRNAALLVAAIARHRAFLTAYDHQRHRWLKGKKRVEFPCGTVWLRRNSPVKCRDPEAPEPGLASMM